MARCRGRGRQGGRSVSGRVDELWAEGLVDHLIVEADGSRGRSLKAFGPHEPQVPVTATTIVQVAGLDALGAPLTDEHVHRSETLAALLAIPLGSTVTARVFADSLRVQVRRLRREGRVARLAALLNKADGPAEQASGLAVAEELLEGAARCRRCVDRRWPPVARRSRHREPAGAALRPCVDDGGAGVVAGDEAREARPARRLRRGRRAGSRARHAHGRAEAPAAARGAAAGAVGRRRGSRLQGHRDDRRRRPRGRAGGGGPRGPTGDRGRQLGLRRRA